MFTFRWFCPVMVRKKAWFPPMEVTLRFCPECGKDDRYKHLGPRHEQPGGGRCPGKIQAVLYVYNETAATGE